MAGYSKELVVGAFLHRFRIYFPTTQEFEAKASIWYDQFGKDEFRKLGSVDAEVIREYKSHLKEGKEYTYA